LTIPCSIECCCELLAILMDCIEGYSKKSEASRRRHAKRGERHEHDQRSILTDATGSMAVVSCYEAKALQLLRLHDGYC
jgi:hypothetical protein